MKCARTACDNHFEFDEPFYRIHNDPNSSGRPPYREYCISCGKRIIDVNNNQTPKDELKLEYTIINLPDELVPKYEDDPHYYRSDAVESGQRPPAAS